MFKAYLRKLARLLHQSANGSSRHKKMRRRLLRIEGLESRDLPAPLAWSAGIALPIADGGFVAQKEGSSLLLLGGSGTTAYTLSAAYPSWQASAVATVQPLDFSHLSPGVGLLPNGYYIVYGGMQNGLATAAATQFDPNTVTVVDGPTNQTHALRSMNVPRADFGWATDASGLAYAIGGFDNNGTPLASVEAYNSSTGTWSYLAPLPQPLYGEAAAFDGAGHIYTFGGFGSFGSGSTAVYRYTIATNTWDQLAAPMQVAERDSAAVLAPNGLIYVLGGQNANGTSAAVQSYNTATNTWNLETSLPQPVISPTAAVDSLGRIEVLGGYDVNYNPLATSYISQEFTQADQAPAITSTAQTAGVLNGGYAYQVTATGNPQPTFSLSSAPAGMTIDPGTGLISWSPAAVGSYAVTVQAANAAGITSQSFSIKVVLPTPAAPTGVAGISLSTTTVGLSWNASTDPYVTSYDVYRQYFVHGSRGSGGSYFYSLVASGISGTSVVLAGSGTYAVTAVNSAGTQSPRSALVSVSVMSRPDLYTAITLSGADISSLTLNVYQTGQIYLIQEFANPAPTFSMVSGPSSIVVNPTTGLVTYTPVPAEIGQQQVTFAATNAAGSSQYVFTYFVQALQPILGVTGGSIAYDGNPHPATGSAHGADGVTPVAGSFTYTYNGSPTPPTAAGVYAVKATFASADPAYASGVATSTLTILPATPTITVSSGPFNYDGNPHGATATAVGIGGVTPVAGSFQFTYSGNANPPLGPGLFVVSASFSSADPNYASTAVTSNLIINSPGTLVPTLTLVDGSGAYDGTPHADSGTAVGNDGVTPVAGAFIVTYNGSTIVPTQTGAYAVVATFISSDLNYENSSITGTLNISPVAPTISFGADTYTYDRTGHSAVVNALGVDLATPVSGSFTVLYNGSLSLPVNAGTYLVSASFVSSDANYISSTATASLTILPATASIGLGNDGQWEFTYNGLPQSVVGSAVGIDGVTPVNGTFTYSYFNEYGSNTQLFGPPLPGAPTNAGSYTFIEYFSSLDPNYASGMYSYYLLIDPASPTLILNGGPFVYNGAAQPAVVTALGIDGVTPVAGSVTYSTYNGSTTVPAASGFYSVFAEFTSSDPNYYSSTVSGTLYILKATPTFTSLSSPTVTLGASSVTISGTIAASTAAPAGDDVAITLNGITEPATVSPGGNFSAAFSLQGLGTGTYPITYKYMGDAAYFTATRGGITGTFGGTLTIEASPTVTTSPLSQTVVSGSSVTFTAAAFGYPTPAVQWQQSTNGTTYANIVGATGPSYTINSVTASQNGYLYRAVFTNVAGSTNTAAATLTVQYAPTVTTNPATTTVTAGQTATFTAAAGGNPAPAVQWQVSTDGGATFSAISGATSTSLALGTTVAGQNGNIYRAVFTNTVGTATTAGATLNVRYAPAVASAPTSQTVSSGATVSFTATATGNPSPTVRWQVSTNGGNSFQNVSGATNTTLTLTGVSSGQNGNEYRAVFTNSIGTATTVAATLTVQFAPSVTTNPTSKTVTAGQNVTFTAAASGNPTPSVQWQVSSNGGSTYADISGATSTTLTLSAVTAGENGYEYRAAFTNSIGSATTTAATLTVQFAPTVTVNPTSQTVSAGHSVTFTAAATGNPTPTVQWQVSTDGGVTFTNISGATNLSFTISSVSASQNGYHYRAIFTNSVGNATSLDAILTVV
jgi:hypothetical protein